MAPNQASKMQQELSGQVDSDVIVSLAAAVRALRTENLRLRIESDGHKEEAVALRARIAKLEALLGGEPTEASEGPADSDNADVESEQTTEDLRDEAGASEGPNSTKGGGEPSPGMAMAAAALARKLHEDLLAQLGEAAEADRKPRKQRSRAATSLVRQFLALRGQAGARRCVKQPGARIQQPAARVQQAGRR